MVVIGETDTGGPGLEKGAVDLAGCETALKLGW